MSDDGEAFSVEGIPQRDSPVTFAKQYLSYFPGEVACFTGEEATALANKGVLVPPAVPPANVDVPNVSQNGSVLNCTDGNWTGEPTSYAFQWKRGATNVGTNAASYTVVAADVGATLTCVVTATNAHGSTVAPASNGVVVTTPPAWTPARLRGGQIVDTVAFLASINAITNGSMAITINGNVVQGVLTDFSGLGTMPLVAAAIGGMLGGATVCRCTWLGSMFEIDTTRTGTAATLTYASAPASGTDISALCHFTAATGAALTQGATA
jgi:hypothetical protein